MIFRTVPPLWAKYAVLSQTVNEDLYFYYQVNELDDAIAKADSLQKNVDTIYTCVFDYELQTIIYELGWPLERTRKLFDLPPKSSAL